jgi:hypothetical protein
LKSILFILLLLATSCAKKEVPPVEPLYGAAYFPVHQGAFVVYDCDSTVYNDLPRDTITYKFRLKERIAGTFTDNEGKQALRMERFVKVFDQARPYDSIAWRLKEVWMVNAEPERITVSEGNLRITRLVFPVRENASWNGNAQNNQGERIFSYEYFDRPEKLGASSFEKVLKVKQRDFKTLISYEGSFEKYASGAGLAQKESASYFSNTIVAGVPVDKRIEYGFIYKQNIVTHGTE